MTEEYVEQRWDLVASLDPDPEGLFVCDLSAFQGSEYRPDFTVARSQRVAVLVDRWKTKTSERIAAVQLRSSPGPAQTGQSLGGIAIDSASMLIGRLSVSKAAWNTAGPKSDLTVVVYGNSKVERQRAYVALGKKLIEAGVPVLANRTSDKEIRFLRLNPSPSTATDLQRIKDIIWESGVDAGIAGSGQSLLEIEEDLKGSACVVSPAWVAVRTGWGDGLYDARALINNGQQVGVLIDFQPKEAEP